MTLLQRVLCTLINASQVSVRKVVGYGLSNGALFSSKISLAANSTTSFMKQYIRLLPTFSVTMSISKSGSKIVNNAQISKKTLKLHHYHTSPFVAAGHNKWSKIKHRKAIADKERSKVIGRFTGLIMTAIKIGGSDPESNLRLENAILRARQAGVPKATIENAILSATAKKSSSAELLVYDARGPSGYHLLIEVLTDNKRKTRPEIRNLLSKHR